MSEKRKKVLRSKLRLVIFVLLLVGIFTGGFAAANNYIWPWIIGSDEPNNDPSEAEEILELPGVNVLLMGVDERTKDKSKRTDTMILANINNEDKRISLLSIPRDTKVTLPRYGVQKINSANFHGGSELAMKTVSELTGVQVDYYITTNFNGFKDIVDALGGVTINVEEPMYRHENAYGGAYDINLPKGEQRLDGNKALMYARYRNYALGDITRTERQLKLLTAIGEEVMQPSSITKLPKLIDQLRKNVDTNIGFQKMAYLGRAGFQLSNLDVVSQTMPGWFLDEDEGSYWYIDPKKAKEVATALFEEGETTKVVQGAMDRTTKSTEQQVAMEETDTAKNDVANATEDENEQLTEGEINPETEDNPSDDDTETENGLDSSLGDGVVQDTEPPVVLPPNIQTSDPEPVEAVSEESGQAGIIDSTPAEAEESRHVEIIINTDS